MKTIGTFIDTIQTFFKMAMVSIPNYDGLYGDLTTRQSSEYIFLELIATRSQTFDWVIQPHIHTHLYQVFIVERGEVTFQEATKTHQVAAPCLFCVPPTQLHGLAYTPDVEGYILTISDSVIEDTFQPIVSIFKTFEKIQILNNFDDTLPFDSILGLIKALESELFSEQSERDLMLRTYLTQFFVKLHRMAKHDELAKSDSRTLAYFRHFQKLIRDWPATKSIADFAAELNITAVHLTRICRTVSGKSPLELVHQNLIGEAQKYLLHTSYSVSEISYLLKFEYPNYFARFFKKRVGVVPNEYRRRGGR
jgi:AraC family transcriptional activator of pobA